MPAPGPDDADQPRGVPAPGPDDADQPGRASARGPDEIDYRFSLANERTFLAWIRTALALVAGGLAAAKALSFHHDVVRWVVAGPPLVAGLLLAADSAVRWRAYEDAMRAGSRLPVGRGVRATGLILAGYALVALLAAALDG